MGFAEAVDRRVPTDERRAWPCVSTRALASSFGLRSSALLPPPQRVQASQLAVKQFNAYVEGVFDCR